MEQDLRGRFSLGAQERPSGASSSRVTRTLAPGPAPLGSDFFPAIAAVRSPLGQCPVSALLFDSLGRPGLCSSSQAMCTQFPFLFWVLINRSRSFSEHRAVTYVSLSRRQGCSWSCFGAEAQAQLLTELVEKRVWKAPIQQRPPRRSCISQPPSPHSPSLSHVGPFNQHLGSPDCKPGSALRLLAQKARPPVP